MKLPCEHVKESTKGRESDVKRQKRVKRKAETTDDLCVIQIKPCIYKYILVLVLGPIPRAPHDPLSHIALKNGWQATRNRPRSARGSGALGL